MLREQAFHTCGGSCNAVASPVIRDRVLMGHSWQLDASSTATVVLLDAHFAGAYLSARPTRLWWLFLVPMCQTDRHDTR